MDDLPALDKGLYQGLVFLKNCSAAAVDDLSLSFSLTDNALGRTENIELTHNGSTIPVTKDNRINYIRLVANYKMNLQIKKQCNAFLRGLWDIIPLQWLKMFNQQELQTLVSGASRPIDLEDMKENTVYAGGYGTDHETIGFFWEVLKGFSKEELMGFVQFVTSCPRPPLLGFKELEPKLCIQAAGDDQTRLRKFLPFFSRLI